MSQIVETIVHEVRESLSMALVAVRTNRLRSVLTLLGIAVGVFSIIAVMTAMGVLVNSIENGISELGAYTFQVQRTPMFHSNDPHERAKLRNRKFIKSDQGYAVKERTTLAKAVGLEAWDFGKVVATQGGPVYATWFFALHIYQQAFAFFKMGYGSSLAWIFVVVLLAFTYFQVVLSRRWVFYAGGE